MINNEDGESPESEWTAVDAFDAAVASGDLALAVPVTVDGRREVLTVTGEITGQLALRLKDPDTDVRTRLLVELVGHAHGYVAAELGEHGIEPLDDVR